MDIFYYSQTNLFCYFFFNCQFWVAGLDDVDCFPFSSISVYSTFSLPLSILFCIIIGCLDMHTDVVGSLFPVIILFLTFPHPCSICMTYIVNHLSNLLNNIVMTSMANGVYSLTHSSCNIMSSLTFSNLETIVMVKWINWSSI